jgi:uncharacterized protein YaiE (UPF0345 family)
MVYKNAVAIASALIALLIFSACSTGGSAIVKPAVTFLGISLSKSVKKQGDVGVPVEPTSTFSTNDKEAVALVSIKNLHYQIRLRWEWYSPDGNLYHTTGNVPVKISTNKYVRQFSAWHVLTIKGDKAGDLPGAWTVKVFMDDEYLDIKGFDLIKSKKS